MNLKETITMLRNLFKQKDYSKITELERFAEIRRHKVPQDVYDYLKNFFDNLHIEIVIHDEEDPNAPMYRNGVGYKTELENGKIKKLVAHYYYTDC